MSLKCIKIKTKIKNENKNQRIYNYNNFIYSETGASNPNYFSALTKHFFSFGDAFYKRPAGTVDSIIDNKIIKR